MTHHSGTGSLSNEHSREVFPKLFFAHGPLLALKSNHRSSHPCSYKYRLSR